MSRVAVLLRGVNVGGSNKVPMAEFAAVLTDLGGQNVCTYLASGQAAASFDAPLDAAARQTLAEAVSQALAERVGVKVAVLVRSHEDLQKVIDENPFPERASTPKQLHAIFIDESVKLAALDQLGLRHGEDELSVAPGVIYASFAAQSHNSALVPVLRRLGGVQTGRNWNTVLKLRELTAPTSST